MESLNNCSNELPKRLPATFINLSEKQGEHIFLVFTCLIGTLLITATHGHVTLDYGTFLESKFPHQQWLIHRFSMCQCSCCTKVPLVGGQLVGLSKSSLGFSVTLQGENPMNALASPYKYILYRPALYKDWWLYLNT